MATNELGTSVVSASMLLSVGNIHAGQPAIGNPGFPTSKTALNFKTRPARYLAAATPFFI